MKSTGVLSAVTATTFADFPGPQPRTERRVYTQEEMYQIFKAMDGGEVVVPNGIMGRLGLTRSLATAFTDPLSEQAYQTYLQACDKNPQLGFDSTPETNEAAIAFLGCICDYYLNKYDGDFIKIEMSDTWQR